MLHRPADGKAPRLHLWGSRGRPALDACPDYLPRLPDLSPMASGSNNEAIVLADGTTLRDAIQYLGKTVPKGEHDHPTVTIAADHLTRSAAQGYPTFFAQAATLQAILRNQERVFNPERKDTHWGKRKLKRDR